MSNSTPSPVLPSASVLLEAAHFISVTQIYFCAMYAVVIWDWIICLPKEWRYIWKTGWTPVKILYLFCRYWPISVMPYILWVYTVNHTLQDCLKLYQSAVALAMWNQAGAEAILLIRTYAFLGRKLWVFLFLSSALCGVVGYQLFVAISEILPLPFVVPPFDKGPCFPMSKPHSAHVLGFFIAPLAFDTVVTVATLVKSIQMKRQSGIRTALVETFLREGIFYFILISIANLINGIFYLQPKQSISALNVPLSIMFPDILACRMVIDLRQQGNSSLEVSMSSITTQSNASKTVVSDSNRIGLGSQTRHASRRSNAKANRVLRKELNDTNETFDSPVELGDISLEGKRHDCKPAFSVTDDVLDTVNGDLGGLRIEVQQSRMTF